MTFLGLKSYFSSLLGDRPRALAKKIGRPVILTSLTMTGMVIGVRSLGLFESSELSLYDQFVRAQPTLAPDERILIVGIDDPDLLALQESFISDKTLARTIDALQVQGPRVIAVDILRDIPTGEGRDQLIDSLNESNVITVCKANSSLGSGVAPPEGVSPESVVSADLIIDPGGILRRSLLFLNPLEQTHQAGLNHICNSPNHSLPSLGFGAAFQYLASEEIGISFDVNDQLIIGSTQIPALTQNFGGYKGADTRGYQVMLRYRAERLAIPMVNLMDVLNGTVSEDLIRDRIIFIGYTAPSIKDDFYTPYSTGRDDEQKMPGVVVHAQSTSQILSVALDGRSLMTDWPWPLETLWIFAWSFSIGIFAWRIRHPVWFGTGVIVACSAAYGISLMFFFQGIWIPIVPALAAIITTAGGVVLFDRFNNSTYGKNVYKKVKTLLNIDIDQEKLNKQVSDITETDYFQELKSTVKTLRTVSKEPYPKSNLNSSSNSKVESSKSQTGINCDSEPASQDLETDNPKEYPEDPHRIDELSQGNDDSFDQSDEKSVSSDESTLSDEFDFLADIKREAQELKESPEKDSEP